MGISKALEGSFWGKLSDCSLDLEESVRSHHIWFSAARTRWAGNAPLEVEDLPCADREEHSGLQDAPVLDAVVGTFGRCAKVGAEVSC